MYYLMEKNERRHRRRALLLTTLIMIALVVGFAYAAGVLDPYIGQFFGAKAAVASV